MPRRTVRVTIPVNKPALFSKLLNDIQKQHIALGDSSPLKTDPDLDMVAYAADTSTSDGFRKESENLREQSEAKMQLAKNGYGTSIGQTVNTPGTLYFRTDIAKKILLKVYKGQEEQLSAFGFNVVIGQAKSPKRKS